MKDTSIIQLFRVACGTAILIASMVTGENGTMQMTALVLLGVPFEAVKYAKETKEKEKSSPA